MEQRRLRLGDILDDYCPRERRVTNHAVVAMIEEEIKQTRCTTCDAEHPYKGGQAPRKRKKDAPAALYKEVLAGITESEPTPVLAASVSTPPIAPLAAAEPVDLAADDDGDLVATSNHDEPSPVEEVESEGVSEGEAVEGDHGSDAPEEGPVHRRLIRATLPRPEGQKDARPLPEFTVRHSGNRPNGNQRDGNRMRGHGSGGGGNGFRAQGGNRFGGPRGSGRGGAGRSGGGFRYSQQPRSGGGRKRSR